MTARIFIVRHGNTFDPGDTLLRVGGRTDLSLSESGRAQAAALAAHFKTAGLSFDSALCSPLARTRETAAPILAACGVADLSIADWLREIDYGPDEGAPEADVVGRLGADALARWETQNIPPPEWRVDPEALIAAWRAYFANVAKREGRHLVVTSNGIARFARPLESGRSNKLATGAYGDVQIDSAGEVRVLNWNLRP